MIKNKPTLNSAKERWETTKGSLKLVYFYNIIFRNPKEQDGEVLPMGSSVEMLSTENLDNDDTEVNLFATIILAVLVNNCLKITYKIK